MVMYVLLFIICDAQGEAVSLIMDVCDIMPSTVKPEVQHVTIVIVCILGKF